jgi:nicotinate-nucleotide--dimethylbenzimidazole phosphoribosyltransferase
VSIDLFELATRVSRPDDDARATARARLADLAPPGAYGRLGELAEWTAGVQGRCPPRPLGRVRLIAVAGSAGSAGPGMLAGSPPSPLLAVSPATPRLVEVFQRIEAGDGDGNPPQDVEGDRSAAGRGGAELAFEAGMTIADEEVDTGADLLVLASLGVDSAIPAATAVAVLTGTDVASVVGRGTGIDDREWMRRCAAVRDSARLARRALADGADVLDLLATLGSAELAVLTGVLARAAIRRTPVVLDGLGPAAAALVAHRLSPRTARWLLAGHASPDPGHAAALDKMRLQPVIDHAISVEDGTGALLAVAHVQAAAQLLAGDETG